MPDLPVLLLLALLLSALAYGLLRWFFPASKSPYHTGLSLEELHQRFRYFGFRQLLVMVGVTLLGSLAAYGVYYLSANLLSSGSLAKSIHLIRADRFARLFIALLGGAALGLALSPRVFRHLLGSDYSAYVDYQNRLTGLDNERTSRWMALFFGLLYAAFTALFLDWYSAFGPAGIRQAPLFATKIREHSYADIEQVEWRTSFRRPDGKECANEYFVIQFRDGEQWNSRNSGYETLDRNRELYEFILSRRAPDPR